MAYLTSREQNNLGKVAQTLGYFHNKRMLDNEEQTTYLEFMHWLDASQEETRRRSQRSADYIRERRKTDKNYARSKKQCQ